MSALQAALELSSSWAGAVGAFEPACPNYVYFADFSISNEVARWKGAKLKFVVSVSCSLEVCSRPAQKGSDVVVAQESQRVGSWRYPMYAWPVWLPGADEPHSDL